MRANILPQTLLNLFVGLDKAGALSLLPGEYQDYAQYLNPASHKFKVDQGRINLIPKPDSLTFQVSGLGFQYQIPGRPDLDFLPSSANGQLNADIVLSGTPEGVSKGQYTMASISGLLSGYANILGDGGSFGSTTFATKNLGLNIGLNGVFDTANLDNWSIKLKSASISYTSAEFNASVLLAGDIQLGNQKFRADIRSARLNYSSALTGQLEIGLRVKPQGGFDALFKEAGELKARVTSDPQENVKIEASEELLQRFGINDDDLNILLAGEMISLDATDVSNFKASLGRSGNDLAPSLSLRLAGESSDRTFGIESALSDFLGLRSTDIKLLVPDVTPPSIARITTQGNQVFLDFNEDIVTSGLSARNFDVRILGKPRKLSGNTIDSERPDRLVLNLTGTAPAATQRLQVSYNGAAVSDLSGNKLVPFKGIAADTFSSSRSIKLLAPNYQTLELTGNTAVTATGNTNANVIIGNYIGNVFNGGPGADEITGLGGQDRYIYTTLTNSLLGSQSSGYKFDHIQDFSIGVDVIDARKAVPASRLQQLGTVAELDAASIRSVLTPASFLANGAACFTYLDRGAPRTFLSINDGIPGFDAARDAVIEITHYSGSLSDLSIV